MACQADWMVEKEASLLLSLHEVVGIPHHKEPHCSPGGDFQRQQLLTLHPAEGCGEGGICVGLGRLRGLCAPEHKWVSMSGRLQAAHACPGPGPVTPPALGRKEGIVRMAALQRKYSCCSSILDCSPF